MEERGEPSEPRISRALGASAHSSLQGNPQTGPPRGTAGKLWPTCPHGGAHLLNVLILTFLKNGGTLRAGTRCYISQATGVIFSSRVARGT